MAILLAGVGAGGGAVATIDLVYAQRAGLNCTLAARRVRANADSIDRGLMELLAKKIGEIFYAHEEKKARH